MEMRMFGGLWPVSALTMGGGGIGQVWGATSREESVATVRRAVESGITLIDVAPTYGDGEAETVVGEAFDGRLPDRVRVLTKRHVGNDDRGDVARVLEEGLDDSLRRLRLDFVDVFLLHSQITPQPDPERTGWTVSLDLYLDEVRSALDDLVARGRIGAWGITAVQFPGVLATVFSESPRPQVAQMIANALDAPGDMDWTGEEVDRRAMIRRVRQRGTAVMGIRAVQAGAFTDAIDRPLDDDHPAKIDFERAAPLRRLAAEMGESTASLAHRYALSIEGVDTVVLGVKNREELAECVAAAERGPLSPEEIQAVDSRLGRA